jgi:hypothetical protein
MIKQLVLGCAVGALLSTSCLAATKDNTMISADKKITYMMPHYGFSAPNYVMRKGGSVVYSNIASLYPNGLYFPFYGLTISGPTSPVGSTIEAAVAFTPTANVTANEVEAGIGFVAGVNGVVMSIYSDASGLPGSSLMDFKASGLPAFGTCCELATGKSKKGVALTAGTQYWFVISTNAAESSTWVAANAETTDTVNSGLAASNQGSGWVSYTSNFLPTVGVFGK